MKTYWAYLKHSFHERWEEYLDGLGPFFTWIFTCVALIFSGFIITPFYAWGIFLTISGGLVLFIPLIVIGIHSHISNYKEWKSDSSNVKGESK